MRYSTPIIPIHFLIRCNSVSEKKLLSNHKVELVFIVSFFITVLLLFTGRTAMREIRRNSMMAASIASSREEDGAVNHVVMYGDSGYVGHSGIYVKYLKEGNIRISGSSNSENYQWKKIADFSLSPGKYTFSGLTDAEPETVQLQLDYPEGSSYCWHFIWNSDIQFTIDEVKEVELYVRAFPGVSVDIIARPAVYRDE